VNGIRLMEVLLNYKWNVYKIFNNGKRAKAPITSFECNEDNVEAFFEEEVKKNFTEKLQLLQFAFLRADLSQERQFEEAEQKKEKILALKRKIFARLGAGRTTYDGPMTGALILSRDTGWKWQWVLLKSASHGFIVGISPTFENDKEADKWMEHQVELYGT